MFRLRRSVSRCSHVFSLACLAWGELCLHKSRYWYEQRERERERERRHKYQLDNAADSLLFRVMAQLPNVTHISPIILKYIEIQLKTRPVHWKKEFLKISFSFIIHVIARLTPSMSWNLRQMGERNFKILSLDKSGICRLMIGWFPDFESLFQDSRQMLWLL